MDDTRGFSGEADFERDFPAADEPAIEAPPVIDERRMHVRAYNHWVSLLDSRPYPLIDDLDPAGIEDFGPYSVLLDFTSGPDNAAIPWLGSALRAEGEMAQDVRSIADVPARSVLSRLTDHYLQIIANRAPIGFEAEYVNLRGLPTMYRGILMPFSSGGDSIDFIYGVINWKEVVEVPVTNDIQEAVASALSETPATAPSVPVWADGPSASPPIDLSEIEPEEEDVLAVSLPADAALYDRLAAARDAVEVLEVSDQRSRAALYAALGQAYDFALATEADSAVFADIMADAGLTMQARAPMTPIVKLIFGIAYDKTRLAEYASVLAHARRIDLASGALAAFLATYSGGLKAVVKAERALRRPAAAPDRDATARAALAIATPLATIDLDQPALGDVDYLSLIARREADGRIAILSASAADVAALVKASKQLKR